MSLFEIDLNYDFKILGCGVFLSENEFYRFYDLNKLYISYMPDRKEMKELLLKNDEYRVYTNNLLTKQYSYTSNDISNYIKNNLYNKKMLSHDDEEFHPEWQLFYIAINKFEALQGFKNNFIKYLELFKYIAEIRYKKWLQYNLDYCLCICEMKDKDKIKDLLKDDLMTYLNNSIQDEDNLFNFLYFLKELRRIAKDIEKYKLMWNIETYIREAISLLLDKGIPTEEIYKKLGGGTYSELHEVHVLKPLYIEESKQHFQQIFLPKITKLFSEATFETVMNYLTYNKKYENIILSYLEVIKYLNANKPNELVIGAMIRNMVLEVEKIIRDSLSKPPKYLNQCLEKLDIYNELFDAIRLECMYYKKSESCKQSITQINNIITTKEDSLEKYFAIYYHSRNYLAHDKIDMDMFFWSNNKIIASSTINAVIIILYRVEMKKNENRYLL